MDFIVEAVLPFIGRVLGYILIELFLHVICYTTGFVIVWLFTFGSKPEKFIPPKNQTQQEYWLYFLGFLFWAVFLVVSALWLWS